MKSVLKDASASKTCPGFSQIVQVLLTAVSNFRFILAGCWCSRRGLQFVSDRYNELIHTV